MSKCVNNYIKVRFQGEHNKVVGTGIDGIEIIRPDKWLHKEEDGKTKYQENVNYLETHPQICEVITPNDKYPYKAGDKLFVHYMAWETAQYGDIVTLEGMINGDYVFFKIREDGSLQLAPDIHIGEPVFSEEVITPSGIFVEGRKKEQLRVKITHVHDPYYKEIKRIDSYKSTALTYPSISVGDIAVSIDKYNYEFNYNGKRYIKLTSSEIAGRYIEHKLAS